MKKAGCANTKLSIKKLILDGSEDKDVDLKWHVWEDPKFSDTEFAVYFYGVDHDRMYGKRIAKLGKDKYGSETKVKLYKDAKDLAKNLLSGADNMATVIKKYQE